MAASDKPMTMDLSRRALLKVSALAGGAGLVNALGFDLKPAYAAARELKISNAREFKTVCPHRAVGCGAIAYVHGSGGLNTVNSIIHVEGDPDSPIYGGTLCPKGAAQMQLAMSPRLQEGRTGRSLRGHRLGWKRHGGQFGRNVRAGRHDQPLERHQERRRGVGHGCEPGGESPVWVQVGARGSG